jgi:hypothetical protein
MVGVVALVLAVAVIGTGTAFAQTRVVPATTVAPPSDDKSKPEQSKPEQPKPEQSKPEQSKPEQPKPEQPKVEQPKVEQPKVEQPKVEQPKVEQPKPEKPKVEQPKPEQPKPEQPKPEEPKVEQPKPEKPKPEQPKPEQPKVEQPKPEQPKPEQPKPEEPKVEQPKPEKPKPEQPKPEQPKPEQPKAEEPEAQKPKPQTPNTEQHTTAQASPAPTRPRPARPKRGQANAPSAQPNEHAPEPQVATTVSPRAKTVPSLAASGARTASPDPLGTDSAGSGGDSADARPVAPRPTAGAPRREPRVASDGVPAAAAIRVDRQPARVLAVESLPGYNVPLLLLTLLLAIAFASGLGYYVGHEFGGPPSIAARRRKPLARALRRPPQVQALSGRVRRSIAAWSAPKSARISTIMREYAMTKEKAFAQGFVDLRSYSRANGAHLASSREAAYDLVRRFRTKVGHRLRPIVRRRPGRRRR